MNRLILLVGLLLPTNAVADGPGDQLNEAAKDAYEKGAKAFKEEAFQTAQHHFEEAMKLEPRLENTYVLCYNLARCEEQQGRFDEAIALWQRCGANKAYTAAERIEATQRGEIVACYARGLKVANAGEHERAVAHFNRCLQLPGIGNHTRFSELINQQRNEAQLRYLEMAIVTFKGVPSHMTVLIDGQQALMDKSGSVRLDVSREHTLEYRDRTGNRRQDKLPTLKKREAVVHQYPFNQAKQPTLAFTAPPPPPPNDASFDWRTTGWITLASGAVITGAGFGVGFSAHSAAEDYRSGKDAAREDAILRMDTGNVLIGTGTAVLVIGGGILIWDWINN